MNDHADARRPPHSAAANAPGFKTVALVLLAFVAMLSAYLLGRATPPPIERASPGPTPQPVEVPAFGAATPGPIADLSGSGNLLAEVTFSDTRQALVLCRRIGSPSRDRITVSYLDTTRDPAKLLGHDEILKTVYCDDCQIDVVELAGDQVGLGTCSTVIDRGAFEPNPPTNMVFALAEPPSGIPSAIGLVVDCGVTSLILDDGELLLNGRSSNPGPYTDAPYPPIRLERRGQRFYADDLPLLHHFCNSNGSQQLSGLLANEERWYSNRTHLAHLEIDSKLGVIGIRRQLLIALTPQQCATLVDARSEQSGDATEPHAPLAEITGLDPPDGIDDWYLTCQSS